MEEDTGEEALKMILENKEKKRKIETLEIIKKGRETLELWNEIKSYVKKR